MERPETNHIYHKTIVVKLENEGPDDEAKKIDELTEGRLRSERFEEKSCMWTCEIE